MGRWENPQGYCVDVGSEEKRAQNDSRLLAG